MLHKMSNSNQHLIQPPYPIFETPNVKNHLQPIPHPNPDSHPLLDVGAPTRALIQLRHQLPQLTPRLKNLPIEAATALPTTSHRAQHQRKDAPITGRRIE